MANALDFKKQQVQEIKENVENAQSIVMVEYRGLTVAEVTELRKQFRENGVNYKVYKNTLANIALKDLGYEGYDEYLKGPNAFIFSNEDLSQGARIARDFAKKNENLVIKAGFLDGEVLDKEKVMAIANLPTREELYQRLATGVKAPITNFVYALNGIISNLVFALSAVKDKANEEGVEIVKVVAVSATESEEVVENTEE